MHKSRKSQGAFNPEKFLTTDEKKNAGLLLASRPSPLCGVVVLAEGFKESLYLELQNARPELFIEGADLQRYVEAVGVLEDLLRRSLAKKKIKLKEDVFAALHLDFLDLYVRKTFKRGIGGRPDSANEQKA